MTFELTTADDLKRAPVLVPLTPSPTRFDGSLAELAERFILPNLSGTEAVSLFHSALAEYVKDPDPLLLVRYVRGTTRGQDYQTAKGVHFRATDNAPVWWTHFALLQNHRFAHGAFGQVVETMPTHMFEVARKAPFSASRAGWHIAHIFDVKDGSHRLDGLEPRRSGQAVRAKRSSLQLLSRAEDRLAAMGRR